jgi:cell division protein FtsI (penicillin-binding protein 3)
MVSFCRALEISSNVGISSLVYDTYGQNRQTRKNFSLDLQQYFLYNRLNSDINVHEPMPIIRSSEYTDDLLRMSFGYVTQMTPLQMLAFYNGIANGGTIVKPLFVKSIMEKGKIIKNMEPVVLKRNMCKTSTLKTLQTILRRVVLFGTGRRLKSASYGIAGKSGTAEINYSSGKVKSKYRQHRASFAGYFPADNPQYSCIVVISSPQKALTHGGDLAAPVFRELSDRVMGVNAQKTQVLSKGNSFKTEISDRQTLNRFHYNKEAIDNALKNPLTPDVRGWNIKDAIYVLEKKGFKVKFSGAGNVKTQSIAPKTKIRNGETIILKL